MIQLTRLNNHPLVVNSDLIKFVEQAPDTVITLVNGDKIVVRESAEDVLGRVVQFRRSVLQGIPQWSETCSAVPQGFNSNADSNPNRNANVSGGGNGRSKGNSNEQLAGEE